MPDLEKEKERAASRSLELIRDGMHIGLGSGSTVAHLVRMLGASVRSGLRVQAVPASEKIRRLAEAEQIPLTSLNQFPELDLAIDGADEFDSELRLIKGGGGALLRERIVASAARTFVIIADSSKAVDRLGGFPLAVEVVPFGSAVVMTRLELMGARTSLRLAGGRLPFRTDENNLIIDCRFDPFPDPERLATELDHVPGIIDHGLFIGMVHRVIVGRESGVEELTR